MSRGAAPQSVEMEPQLENSSNRAIEERALESGATALVGGAALFEGVERAVLAVEGSGALTFLERVITQRVEDLEVGEGREGALLNRRGQLQAHFLIARGREAVYLDLEAALVEGVAGQLERLCVADQAEMKRPLLPHPLLLYGPKAPALLAGVWPSPLPEGPVGLAEGDRGVLLFGSSWTDRPGYHLYGPLERLEELRHTMLEAGAVGAGSGVWEAARIHAGLPRAGREIDGRALLPEFGLSSALETEKGCYLGQEVIARIRFQGQIQWRLRGLRLEAKEVPSPESPVLNEEGREIGKVTSGVFSPWLRCPVALARLRRGFWEAGTSVSIPDGGRGVVADWPISESRDG